MYCFRSLVALGALTLLAACQGDDLSFSSESPAGQRGGSLPAPSALGTGWVQLREGQPVEVTFAVRNGRAIFEGDIDLGPVDKIPSTRDALASTHSDGVRSMGSITTVAGRNWALGRVPYVIDPALPNPDRVVQAIAHIEALNGGVDFVPRAAYDTDYLYITRHATECNSWVGRMGGMQVVNLADGCLTGSTIHELLHALGMWHEQSRCDRDSYVEILLENVIPGYEHAFNRYCSGAADVLDYDEGSIMHYGPRDFSKNDLPTIRSRRGKVMGQKNGMSATDIETVRYMYPLPQCGDWVCQRDEPSTCRGDCPVCGDGICETAEAVMGTCVPECGPIPSP